MNYIWKWSYKHNYYRYYKRHLLQGTKFCVWVLTTLFIHEILNSILCLKFSAVLHGILQSSWVNVRTNLKWATTYHIIPTLLFKIILPPTLDNLSSWENVVKLRNSVSSWSLSSSVIKLQTGWLEFNSCFGQRYFLCHYVLSSDGHINIKHTGIPWFKVTDFMKTVHNMKIHKSKMTFLLLDA
jgi:hypothetical protein